VGLEASNQVIDDMLTPPPPMIDACERAVRVPLAASDGTVTA
jgi:hypothetical protein